MNFLFCISLTLTCLSGLAALSLMWYLRMFSRNARTTVGQTIGTQGKRVLVKFRDGKRIIVAPAACFAPSPIHNGSRVTIKYLDSSRIPQKWDIRIIGKAGYGQRRIKRISAIFSAVSICCAVFSVLAFIYF